MPFSAISLGWQCLSRRDAGRALAFHGLLELDFAVLNLTKCLIAWGAASSVCRWLSIPSCKDKACPKRETRARLCTHWMSTILGRSQSEVVDLNTKGVIIFGAKNRALTLKLWWYSCCVLLLV